MFSCSEHSKARKEPVAREARHNESHTFLKVLLQSFVLVESGKKVVWRTKRRASKKNSRSPPCTLAAGSRHACLIVVSGKLQKYCIHPKKSCHWRLNVNVRVCRVEKGCMPYVTLSRFLHACFSKSWMTIKVSIRHCSPKRKYSLQTAKKNYIHDYSHGLYALWDPLKFKPNWVNPICFWRVYWLLSQPQLYPHVGHKGKSAAGHTS